MPPDPLHQFWIVPLVNDHQIGPGEYAIQVKRLKIVLSAGKSWIVALKFLQSICAIILEKISIAPTLGRLEHYHIVTTRLQLRYDAAQEVCVAMIPIRHQRVVEHYDPHDITPRIGTL